MEYKQIIIDLSDFGSDNDNDIKKDISLGLINDDLSPKKCKVCGCVEFETVITSCIEYIVIEKESRCTNCNVIIGYWVAGNWIP